MRKLAFLFLIFVNITITEAQQSFEPGFIIKNNGDTLKGLVKNFKSKKNYQICLFKTDSVGEVVEYTPNMIKQYGIGTNQKYCSYTCNSNTNSKVFYETLVDGNVNLYKFKDESGKTTYLFEKENGELTTIKSNDENERENIQKGKLLYTFKDAPELKENINKMNLDQNSIVKITKEYHYQVCPNEECIIYTKSKNKVNINLGIKSGLSLSNIMFLDSERTNLDQNYDWSKNYIYGAYLNINDPLISERLKIQLEVLFQEAEYKSKEMNWKTTNTQIPILVRYSLTNTRLSPNISFGTFYNNFKKISADSILIIHDDFIINSVSIPGSEKFTKTHSFGVLSGFGINYSISKNLILTIDTRASYAWGSLGFDYEYITYRGNIYPWRHAENYSLINLDAMIGLELKIR